MTTVRIILATILSVVPILTMAQPVRNERIDFPPAAIGTTDEREVRIDNLTPNAVFVIIDSCDAPFRITTPTSELVAKNGELRIRCEFLPTRPGSFRDELLLEQRPPGMPMNERIRIRINGTGFRIERLDRVEYGDVMIGDSTRRMVFIRDEFLRDVRWSLTAAPGTPFSTPDATAPYRPDRDTIGFRFAFAPITTGRFLDTVGLIRTYIPTGEALDTIFVVLDGTGVKMQDSSTVFFRDLTPGMTVTSELALQLPTTTKTREFVYSLQPRVPSGVVSGELKDPKGPSRAPVIVSSFTAKPRSSRDLREQFVLYRTRTDGRLLDSTIITALVTMLPQPIVLGAAFRSDTLVHRIGDTVSFEILATSAQSIDQSIVLTDVVAECAINGTVIVPLTDDQVSLITRDDRTYVRIAPRAPVTVTASGDVLLRWSGVVVLGDAASSPLALEPVTARLDNGQLITLESNSAVLRVANVWTMPDGTPRLVNPRVSQLEMTVAPNPMDGEGTLTIDEVPAGGGRLEIVDTRGLVVSDLTQAVRSGRTEFRIATSGVADIVVQPGVYYARLSAQLSPSEPLASVVRAFVIR